VIEAIYETGMIGTVALLTFFWITLRQIQYGLRAARDPKDRFAVLAPTVMIFIFGLQTMVHWDLDGARFLYLFAGLLHVSVVQVAHGVTTPMLTRHSISRQSNAEAARYAAQR